MTRKRKEIKEVKLSSKASRYRSSWKKRAIKLNMDVLLVPDTKLIKKWLDDQYPYKCYMSGSPLAVAIIEIDHRIPISRGGTFSLSNLGITSRFYNNAKGDMTENEFRKLLKCISKWEDKGNSLLLRLIKANRIYKR